MKRYATWDDVFDYCRYSANPVGRLVLYLCGYRDAERQRLSDATCTALQLANFWQDVSRDLEKGRIYIPLEALAAHGLSEDDIVAAPVRRALRFADEGTDRAHAAAVRRGNAARRAASMPRLRVDIEMFSRGGLAVLDAIEAIGYNTLEHRPSIPKSKQFRLLARALVMRVLAFAQRFRQPVAAHSLPDGSGRCRGRMSAVRHWQTSARNRERSLCQSYAECRRVARAVGQQFLLRVLHVAAAPSATPCARCTPSCASSTTFRTRSASAADKQRGLARWRAAAAMLPAARRRFGPSDSPGICGHHRSLPDSPALFP